MHVQFGRFTFDSEMRLLSTSETAVRLSPKAFRLLEVLLSTAPKPVAKKDLLELIWPDTFVEESSLPALVTELRAALDDDSKAPTLIRTVHRFGYAFCGELANVQPVPRLGVLLFRGAELPLYEGENVLGRDASADVCIDDHTVSRRHASITLSEDAAVLRDLKSKNGTVVDDRNVRDDMPLQHGQTIVLGDARVVFRRDSLGGSTITLERAGRRARGTQIPDSKASVDASQDDIP